MADVDLGVIHVSKVESITYDNDQSTKPTVTYGDGSQWLSSNLLDSSSYYKYNLATNGSLDWREELKNLSSFQSDRTRDYTAPTTDIRNESITKEKQRIKTQSDSAEFHREDFFAVGTVYLSIPPTQISVTEEKHNFRYKSLRSAAETITASGRSTTRIDLDIYFNGLDDINNKLRPLIAQFKCTPFLPIENDYVRTVIDPESRGVNGELDQAKSDRTSLNKKKDEIDNIQVAESAKAGNVDKVIKEVKSLESRKIITPLQSSRISSLVNQWYLQKNVSSILADPDAAASLVTADYGSGYELDLKKYIYRVVTLPNNLDNNFASLNRSINDIDALSKSIDSYERSINTLFDKNLEQRFRNKRIAGVLSQMTISTMPGYPETLSCRISMHVFNYDPYTFDFGFVQGYDPGKYTPDITQCDLFVDWYANRFLREDNKKGTLGTYSASNYMVIRYTKNISYEDLIYNSIPEVISDTVVIEDETFVTGISVTMRNIVQFLPILSGDKPTCQYLGAYNTSVVVNISSKNLSKIKELRTMMSVVSRIARTNNKLGRYNMFLLVNPLVGLCGLNYFILESFSIDTVPGSPGLYSINMEASEIKLGLEKSEQLNRLTLDSNDRVIDAAGYILDKAREYMMDTSPGKANTIGYRVYYDMLYGNDNSNNVDNTTMARVIRTNTQRRDSGVFSDYYNSPERSSAIKRIEGQFVTESSPSRVSIPGVELPMERAVVSADNTEQYIRGVYNCMSGDNAQFSDGQTMDWDTEKQYLQHALAEEEMQNIKVLLLEDTGLVDLKNAVFSQASKIPGLPKNVVDPTCYPDLELPTYNDLGGKGEKFKLTYADVGLLTSNTAMRNNPAQTDWVAIEPDAFYSKNSIYTLMENLGNPGMEVGFKAFQNMALNNLASEASPLDPSIFVNQLERSTSLNEDATNVDIETINDVVSSATAALSNEELVVVKALDGNTFEVKASTMLGNALNSAGMGNVSSEKSYYLRFMDYNPKKYSGGNQINQPTIFQSQDKQNTDIANKVLVGKKVYASLINNTHFTTKDGKVVLGAIGTYYNEDTKRQESIAATMASEGMSMNKDPQTASDNSVNSINSQAQEKEKKQILAETHIRASRNKGTPVTNNTASSTTGVLSDAKNLNKTDDQEVTSVGVQTETMKGNDPESLISGRYIYPAAVRAFGNQNYNKNSTIQRFDRYSQQHINGIMERVKGQSKDDKLRMVRAFPTFKFYFVEEDKMEYKPWFLMGEFKNLNDLYSYSAILSMDITKSRKDAADVAVVQILNTKGVLDRERFGLYGKDVNFLTRNYEESADWKTKETIEEQDVIEEFVLKVGARIKIKMGYSSDPAFLETVFTGMVSEVNTGDIITIVAQGYGVELMKPITGWGNRIKFQDYSAYKILDKIIKRPEVSHFGFAEWQPIIDVNQKILGRRMKPATGPYSPDMYKLRHPSSWRTWLGVSYFLTHGNDPRNDNIFTPEVSKWAEETKGDGWEFTCENRTVWDIFQEFTRRMPGYVAQVLPFDERATIYFGPSDGYYNYSNEVRGLLAESKAYVEDPELLIDSAKNAGDITELTLDQKKSLLNNVNNIINRAKGDTSSGLKDGLISGTLGDRQASWILSITEEYLGKTGQEEDRKTIEDFRKMGETEGIFYSDNIKKDPISLSEGNVSIFNSTDEDKLANLTLYQSSDGRYVDKETYVSQKWSDNLKFPAHFKLIRSYHYVDSLRNIISNNITASEETMWNRVEVITNAKTGFVGTVIRPSSPNPLRVVRAQVDDSIWKENLITKVVSEPNATTPLTAWMYAIGNLRYGVNEMYGGHLTVLGDPTIKPNDVIFLNDYYTDMHGAFEVREVTHHFSHDTGFVTTVVPDCICYANNSMAMASEALAGGWYDDVANSMLWIYNVKVPFVGRVTPKQLLAAGVVIGGSYALGALQKAGGATSLLAKGGKAGEVVGTIISRPPFIRAALMAYGGAAAVRGLTGLAAKAVMTPVGAAAGIALVAEKMFGKKIRNSVQALQFGIFGWTADRREPINFLPLYYAGRAYLAGVKGLRKSDWWEPYAEGWQRFVYYHLNLAPRYLSQMYDQAVSQSLSSNLWQQKVEGSTGI